MKQINFYHWIKNLVAQMSTAWKELGAYLKCRILPWSGFVFGKTKKMKATGSSKVLKFFFLWALKFWQADQIILKNLEILYDV